MDSPIQRRVGQVFIPVSDLSRSIPWYSALFGVAPGEPTHEGTIYNIPMDGETRLALDATKPDVTPSSQPLCYFWTDDIQAAHAFLVANYVQLASEIQDIGSVSFLTFKDPDGNLLLVCQANEGVGSSS